VHFIKNINKFISSSLIFFCAISIVVIAHYIFSDYTDHKKDIRNFTQLTKLPIISKSVSYLEPKFFEYKDYRDTIYPELKPVSYMRFTYE
jgi:hypothetical protein